MRVDHSRRARLVVRFCVVIAGFLGCAGSTAEPIEVRVDHSPREAPTQSATPKTSLATHKSSKPSEATDDRDGDGVPDGQDRCVFIPEDFNGVEDDDGCPEAVSGDVDGDGVSDATDSCPDAPEDFDGYFDDDGCPDDDNDGDGILDSNDACPSHPEVYNGRADLDGCPD